MTVTRPAGEPSETGRARAVTAERPRAWNARTRTTPDDALRYSRFVTVMKRALPIAAAALVAAIVVYAVLPREQGRIAMTFERMGTIDNDLAMINPRLSGTDSEGRPYVVTADAAIQDPGGARKVRLKGIVMDVTLSDGSWLNVAAADGMFDGDARTVRLSGAVDLYLDTGYELHTAQAAVDLAANSVTGGLPVSGQGPMGTIRAGAFAITERGRKIALTGGVQTVIYDLGGRS